MGPEDKSLMYTEIGDSLVVITVKQQEEYSQFRSAALGWVSRLNRYLQCTILTYMLQNCCIAAQHLEQGPKFSEGGYLRLGTLLPTRVPNRLQSIIDRLRPAEMPKEAFCLDHSKQS